MKVSIMEIILEQNHFIENATVFARRDPLGIKALYYTKTSNGYRFSSQLNTLLALPSVVKKPNLHAMTTMMQGFAVGYEETMYEGIYRVPPGHCISIENGEKKLERYWFPEKIEIDYSISEEEAAKKLKELLKKAVEKSVTSLEQTAFELSGGLDSSSVVSLLAKTEDARQIDSYSMDFATLNCDEGAYVDALLNKYPVHHQKVFVANLDYKNKYSLEHLYEVSPHWPIGLTFAILLPMLEQMKAEGKNVVVSGQGGDHLFSGSPYVLYDLFVRRKFGAFYEALKSYKRPWSAFKAYVLIPMLGERNTLRIKKLLGKKPKKKSFWDACDIVNFSDTLVMTNPALKNELDMLTTAYHSTVMDANIFHCAKEHFGIEYRYPFFDKALVEFALSLPVEMKYTNRRIKGILRKAMKGVLPEKIRLRQDKAEFSEILCQQIAAIDVEALLCEANIVKLGLIRQEDVDLCKKRYEAGETRYVSYFWVMLNMEYWYQHNQFEDVLNK